MPHQRLQIFQEKLTPNIQTPLVIETSKQLVFYKSHERKYWPDSIVEKTKAFEFNSNRTVFFQTKEQLSTRMAQLLNQNIAAFLSLEKAFY